MPVFKYRSGLCLVNCLRCRRRRAIVDPQTDERRDLCWKCAAEVGTVNYPKDRACRRCWLVTTEEGERLCPACKREVQAAVYGYDHAMYTKG